MFPNSIRFFSLNLNFSKCDVNLAVTLNSTGRTWLSAMSLIGISNLSFFMNFAQISIKSLFARSLIHILNDEFP